MIENNGSSKTPPYVGEDKNFTGHRLYMGGGDQNASPMKLLGYSFLWTLYIIPLFIMLHTLAWCNQVGYLNTFHRELDLIAIAVWIIGFYGSLWLYCDNLKDYGVEDSSDIIPSGR